MTFYMLSGYSLHAVGLELDAIAAVVIGGTLLAGGVGYVAGTLFGVLILGIIQTLIAFDGTLSSWWTKIVVGALLLLFCLLQRLFEGRTPRWRDRPCRSAHSGGSPTARKSTSYTLGSADGLQAEILTLGGTLRSLTLPGEEASAFRWCCRCRTCRPTSRTPLIWASSSAAMAIASPAPRSTSTAKLTSSPPTTAPTRCTAATWVSASTCGKCSARGGGKNTYVKLGHRSPAGINGFPGNLDVTALISVYENTLTLAYEATTDAPTPDQLHLASLFHAVGRSRR